MSYCNDTVSYFDENYDPRNDDDRKEYNILDIDNFLKITEIDYENG